MSIETKTLAFLVDELITTSQKMFRMQDEIPKLPDAEAGAMAKQLQTLNRRRSDLMRAIDKRIGDGDSTVTPKTYK